MEDLRYAGESYGSLVPDTLDLQHRAKLAINAITRNAEPRWNYAMYFTVVLAHNPPLAYDGVGPWIYGQMQLALPLLRLIAGDDLNNLSLTNKVDRVWRDQLWQTLESYKLGKGTGVGQRMDGGSRLTAIAVNWFMEGNEELKLLAEKAINQAVQDWPSRNKKWTDQTVMEERDYAWDLDGVAQYYLATGYEPAKQLAKLIARFLMSPQARYFDADGHFMMREIPRFGNSMHFHHHGKGLRSIGQYRLISNDSEVDGFLKKCYDYARSVGNPLVGFFPEFDGPNPWHHFPSETWSSSEGCCVGDMILFALILTRTGVGDFWDDIDRWVRNQFTEMQLTNTDWIAGFSRSFPPCPDAPEDWIKHQIGENWAEAFTYEDFPDRVLGEWGGWTAPNDFEYVPYLRAAAMHCCLAVNSLALFNVWKDMLSYAKGSLQVHLLMNRASRWADVHSYIPYEGRVDIHVKQPLTLRIRAPEWVSPKETTCTIDGEPQSLSWDGHYAVMSTLEAGNTVVVSFPMEEQTVETVIGGRRFTLIRRGNEVVNIDPPGEYYPFYNWKEKYRACGVQWRNVTRFVPTKLPMWVA